MGSFLRKQPSFLLILLILHLGAREASALSSDDEALLAFKKAVTTSDGIFLNWREQDVYPCNWKVVRCHSHTKRVIYLSPPSSTLAAPTSGCHQPIVTSQLCASSTLTTSPGSQALIRRMDVFLRSSIIIPYDEVWLLHFLCWS
ncbi:LRR receptor-like serine/threonine-protein kinase FEI 2 isoform X1 [Oryza sativa Japonica Group]|uniref:LRR receptor-like serine/threonine-protein kinase FEI 2 isoform X1 n=2 Tax=Oryza sativa subsp. japonica TaxID=39947 RepID=UPI00339CE4FD